MPTSRAQRAKTAERRAQAINLRISGVDWETIATRLGYANRSAACTDVSRALEANQKAAEAGAEDLRTLDVARLDALLVKTWSLLDRDYVVYSGGKPVMLVGPDGEEVPLIDAGPALAAIDRVVKIMERRAKLLGLDAPTKLDHGGVVKYVIEGIDLEALR